MSLLMHAHHDLQVREGAVCEPGGAAVGGEGGHRQGSRGAAGTAPTARHHQGTGKTPPLQMIGLYGPWTWCFFLRLIGIGVRQADRQVDGSEWRLVVSDPASCFRALAGGGGGAAAGGREEAGPRHGAGGLKFKLKLTTYKGRRTRLVAEDLRGGELKTCVMVLLLVLVVVLVVVTSGGSVIEA